MRKPNGKKFILWILTLALFVSTCAPAFASVGDRVLQRTSRDEVNFYIQDVLMAGDIFYIITRTDEVTGVLKYTDVKAEPEAFELDEHQLRSEEEEPEEEEEEEAENQFGVIFDDEPEETGGGYSAWISCWFSWNDELYALLSKDIWSGNPEEQTKNEIYMQHVKLENGQAILEDSGLPEMDFTNLMEGEEGEYQYMRGVSNAFTIGNKLMMTVYSESGELLETIDLEDGSITETELGEYFSELVPGPDGSLLKTKAEWSETDYTTTITISRMDPESGAEETLAELPGLTDSRISPCYDAEKDTLYFLRSGELWAMPQFDTEKITAVNDCQSNGGKAYMLKDGFVLISNYDAVMVKNTDPAQRGSITLRIMDNGWGRAMGETIYDMNNTRGDISVVLQQEWSTAKQDVLQAMMNRDGSIDIYVLQYDGNEFSALRNRDYLPDLSGNAKIVENTERMYPFVQDAVKQNGKIIGIPVNLNGESLGIDREAWKNIGGTEEELPKTWSQFFDWLGTLPERLEGQEVCAVETYEDRVYFRAQILLQMLKQYEIWMESKGDTGYAFASPLMCDLTARLNSLDYDALGIQEHPEEEDMEEDGYLYNEDEEYKRPLLYLYASNLMDGDNTYTPLVLSFTEEEEAAVPVQMSVAFLNPYSEHQQEAMEFLSLAMDNLDIYSAYAAYTDKTEPVRDPYADTNLKWYNEQIEKVQKKVDKAKDEEDKATWEEQLKSLKMGLEDMEKYSWRISAGQIESYQQRKNMNKIMGYSFLNDVLGETNDEESYNDFYEMFYSNEGMKMDPAELLGKLDKKVQMIRMERN